jgi:IclR family transcriptional regulator, KDG regulon repressor
VGRRIPARCTASGRALLFDHDTRALVDLFGREPFAPQGPNAPADVGDLERRIRRERQVGYAFADQESERGLVAVAAPIRDFTGGVVAAINISAPKYRLGTRLHVAGEMVRETSQRLSETLGAPGPDRTASLSGASPADARPPDTGPVSRG